jgi:hypothetical protein
MSEAPFHRITRTEVKLEIVKAEKDVLVICHCTYCDDFIIGWVSTDNRYPYDGPIIRLKTKCDHFEYFDRPWYTENNKAVFNPPAPF